MELKLKTKVSFKENVNSTKKIINMSRQMN